MVRRTYWIGNPPPAPGRDGGANTKAWRPAFSLSRFWISCLVWTPFFSRSLHSLSLKPRKPPPPPSMPTTRKLAAISGSLPPSPFVEPAAEEAAAAPVDADDEKAGVDLGDLRPRARELGRESLSVVRGG